MGSQIGDQFEQALLSLDRLGTKEILIQLKSFMTSGQIIEDIIVPSMERIGEGWEEGNLALSQVYMAGRICKEIVDEISLPKTSLEGDRLKIAICVLEDYHMLGKRIVYNLMRASGYELLDYGRVTVDELVERIKEDRIKILLLSVLMLPSALQIKNVTEKLKQEELETKIIVGGAPFRFDNNLWKEVGADAMGYAASDAAGIVSEFQGESI